MHRCGVSEPLQIGANGFPVPGQLSVWGSVPYPDQTGGKAKGKAVTVTAKAKGKNNGTVTVTAKAKGKNNGKVTPKVANQTAL